MAVSEERRAPGPGEGAGASGGSGAEDADRGVEATSGVGAAGGWETACGLVVWPSVASVPRTGSGPGRVLRVMAWALWPPRRGVMSAS